MHINLKVFNGLLGFLFLQNFCFAINTNETNNQQWFQYYNQLKLKEKIYIPADFGIRYKNNFDDKTQSLIRVALKYSNKNISYSFGLGNINYFDAEQIKKIEFRPHQELNMKKAFAKIELNHRIRTEQQIFSNSDMKFEEFTNRIRYRLMMTISILKFNQSAKTLDLILGDELFLIGKNSISSVQNRLLLGASLKLAKNLSVSVIYNRQNLTKLKSNYNRLDYIVWVGISHNLDFSKSNKMEN